MNPIFIVMLQLAMAYIAYQYGCISGEAKAYEQIDRIIKERVQQEIIRQLKELYHEQ